MSARREELLDVAAQVFAAKGYASATVRDIAAAANLNSGTLYHHFESKEQIVEEILQRYWVEMLARFDVVVSSDGRPMDLLARMIRETLMINEAMPFAAQLQSSDWNYLLNNIQPIRGYVRTVGAHWTSVIVSGMESGAMRNDFEARMVVESIMASMSGLVVQSYHSRSPERAQKMADTQVELWKRALAPQ